jgi:hypothetical protein
LPVSHACPLTCLCHLVTSWHDEHSSLEHNSQPLIWIYLFLFPLAQILMPLIIKKRKKLSSIYLLIRLLATFRVISLCMVSTFSFFLFLWWCWLLWPYGVECLLFHDSTVCIYINIYKKGSPQNYAHCYELLLFFFKLLSKFFYAYHHSRLI